LVSGRGPTTIPSPPLLLRTCWLRLGMSGVRIFLERKRGLFISEAQHVRSIFMLVFMVSWLCLNAALTLGLAYRKNWARVTEMLLIPHISTQRFFRQNFYSRIS
jgi:hypothetical protein